VTAGLAAKRSRNFREPRAHWPTTTHPSVRANMARPAKRVDALAISNLDSGLPIHDSVLNSHS
jgi:hypothetical protein